MAFILEAAFGLGWICGTVFGRVVRSKRECAAVLARVSSRSHVRPRLEQGGLKGNE
jgi:hypothetical protein